MALAGTPTRLTIGLLRQVGVDDEQTAQIVSSESALSARDVASPPQQLAAAVQPADRLATGGRDRASTRPTSRFAAAGISRLSSLKSGAARWNLPQAPPP